jgi:hypothetical protein
MTVPDRRPSTPDRDDAADGEGRWVNLIIVAFVVVVIGAGLWLVDALVAARKADECMSSGRRNCTPVEVPATPPR